MSGIIDVHHPRQSRNIAQRHEALWNVAIRLFETDWRNSAQRLRKKNRIDHQFSRIMAKSSMVDLA